MLWSTILQLLFFNICFLDNLILLSTYQLILLTYFPALVSLLRASLEMTWPQISFMGGLLSEVCCRRIGQANTEWYQHFFPRSISIYKDRHDMIKLKAKNERKAATDGNSNGLTGSSSLCVQTPLHCLCSITCLMFISTGKAIQPDAKLQKSTHGSVSKVLIIGQNLLAHTFKLNNMVK